MKSKVKQMPRVTDRLKKKYSHPEFLREFFPKVKIKQEAHPEVKALTKEQFMEMLGTTSSMQSPAAVGNDKDKPL